MDSCGIIAIIVAVTVVLGVVITMYTTGQKKPGDDALKAEVRTALAGGEIDKAKVALTALAIRIRAPDYTGFKKVDANETYQLLLAALSKHPQLRPQALEFGRLSYGIGRPKGNPTVYDESAIANDIAAHS